MSRRAAANTKYTTNDGFAYLTKRKLVSTAQAAGKKAAKEAMETMGYVVVEQDGQIVKKWADGKIEVLEEVNK
jgi:hypothetical protein